MRARATLGKSQGPVWQSDLNVIECCRLVGKAMVLFQIIAAAAGLPNTKNGKIMRRAIRACFLGEPAGDMSALDSSTPLDLIPVRA